MFRSDYFRISQDFHEYLEINKIFAILGFEVECDSNLCLASGGRVLESLLNTLLHEVEVITNIDSGIDSGDAEDLDDPVDEEAFGENFSLCVACTASIPKVFSNN